MRKKTQNEARNLTAKQLRRMPRFSDTLLERLLADIQSTAMRGATVHSIPKSTPRIREELIARGFKIQDTGMVWHITWTVK